jgi:hypothetical protein
VPGIVNLKIKERFQFESRTSFFIITFSGNESSRRPGKRRDDEIHHGAVAHVSHWILVGAILPKRPACASDFLADSSGD